MSPRPHPDPALKQPGNIQRHPAITGKVLARRNRGQHSLVWDVVIKGEKSGGNFVLLEFQPLVEPSLVDPIDVEPN